MMMFGPPDIESPNSENALKWRIKRETNDELRFRFVEVAAEQVKFLNMTLPDLTWNEAEGRHDFGELDWNHFWEVVKGNGPCNKQRLAARNKAHADGAWVREAALAYSEKRKNTE